MKWQTLRKLKSIIACLNLLWFVLELSVQKQEVQFYVTEI